MLTSCNIWQPNGKALTEQDEPPTGAAKQIHKQIDCTKILNLENKFVSL